MKVKIKGPVALKLKSGRPFHAIRGCECDLDRLGYSDKEQEELLANDAIEPMDKAPAKKKGS